MSPSERQQEVAALTTSRGSFDRISRLEVRVAGAAALVLLVVAIAEPDALEAPIENTRTMLFTFGGTAAAVVALVVMLRLRVPPVVRVLTLGVPFVAASWWLLSPFFVEDVVNDEFTTSIADAEQAGGNARTAPSSTTDASASASSTAPAVPAGPRLRGSGRFVGLAGHDGSGAAGFFALEDGSQVLRFEEFDIENGPDLRLYLVPGADRTDPSTDSLYLGELRGTVGDQTYELPGDFELTAGDWTVLVWCEAFSVEFVAASVAVT